MTVAQKRLRELRERQSRERQRIAELSRETELTDETCAEFDRIEAGTPDLERRIRAAVLAVEQEDDEKIRHRESEPHAEMRERIELRRRARLTYYPLAAAHGRMVDGAESKPRAAAGVQGIPLELWYVPAPERRNAEERDVTAAPAPWG